MHGVTFDAATELKDSGAVTASGVAQVGGTNQILDLGGGELFDEMVVDVTAIDIASNDELYTLILQGSNTSNFASDVVELAVLRLGANEVLSGDVDSIIGRYMVPFSNNRNEISYRYLRLNSLVSGTTPSVTFNAYLGKARR